jgi:Zn ribbon nucleic-acid-binding protein
MSSKVCPVCLSERVKEYKKDGVPELRCLNCNYDSGDKYHPARHRRDRERERDRQGAR